jgi:hypothetical protein
MRLGLRPKRCDPFADVISIQLCPWYPCRPGQVPVALLNMMVPKASYSLAAGNLQEVRYWLIGTEG